MAHGLQERWVVGAHRSFRAKHLLPIKDKTPMLKRTIDLFEPHGDIFTFAWKWYEEWIEYSCLPIHPVRSLLDGVLQTRQYWSDRTIFLLGDVLFSRQAVLDISKINKLKFFGRPAPNRVTGKRASELFGFTMMRNDWDQIIEHCEFMTVPTGKPKNLKYPPKLWALYRLCCGNEVHQDIIDLDYLWVIDDYTDDIDSPEAWKRFWGTMIKAEAKDN